MQHLKIQLRPSTPGVHAPILHNIRLRTSLAQDSDDIEASPPAVSELQGSVIVGGDYCSTGLWPSNPVRAKTPTNMGVSQSYLGQAWLKQTPQTVWFLVVVAVEGGRGEKKKTNAISGRRITIVSRLGGFQQEGTGRPIQ